MRDKWTRVGGAVSFLVVLAGAGSLAEGETVRDVLAILFVLLGLPLVIVTLLDVLVGLRTRPPSSGLGRSLVVLLSAPLGALGLTSLAFGAAIIAWVLYNLLVETQPQFSGWSPFISFGIAPTLIGFGWFLVRLSVIPDPRSGFPTPEVSAPGKDR